MNERIECWRFLVEILFGKHESGKPVELLAAADSADGFWREAITLANVEKVTAVFWSMLSERHDLTAGLGVDEREYVTAFHDLIRERNAAIEEQLILVLRALVRAGIPGMPIKGAAYLLARQFPNVGTRFMSDIDLLVPGESARTARSVLIGEGYREVAAGPDAGDEHHHLTALFHEDLPAAIELHTAVVPGWLEAALPTASVWTNATPHVAGDVECFLPRATDAATISFVHSELVDRGTELLLIPLRPFHDLHMLYRGPGPEVSWSEVARRAASVGAAKRFRRYSHVYHQLSGHKLLPGQRYAPADALAYRLSVSAIGRPSIRRWRLRADRLSERRLRRRFNLRGGKLELNRYRLKRAIEMLVHAITGREDADDVDR